jgi:nitroreductase
MQTIDAITARRSIKRFANRQIPRDEVEPLLELAVLAPNHRLTQPWRFYILGPEARYGYGLALGERKATKQPNADAARKLRDTVAEEHRALPCMIVVAVVDNENPEIRDEDGRRDAGSRRARCRRRQGR